MFHNIGTIKTVWNRSKLEAEQKAFRQRQSIRKATVKRERNVEVWQCSECGYTDKLSVTAHHKWKIAKSDEPFESRRVEGRTIQCKGMFRPVTMTRHEFEKFRRRIAGAEETRQINAKLKPKLEKKKNPATIASPCWFCDGSGCIICARRAARIEAKAQKKQLGALAMTA